MKESIFQTKVQKLRRIVIPRQICDALRINEGDKVEIKITKVGNNAT
jgi:AbrB family looped-hinge helix DNA binding protein